MKYILTCGTNDPNLFPDVPRQMSKINGEILVARTIRLLREYGVKDISITSMDDRFEQFGVPVIKYDSSGHWVNCFYNTGEPTCYIFGDVYFSRSAIRQIVEKETTEIDFFASSKMRIKKWNEPFAYKVVNMKKFFKYVEQSKRLYDNKILRRCISWELWQVIMNTPLNRINYKNFTAIDNDFCCDVDHPDDITLIENNICTEPIMIHAVPDRLWYVNEYLIPSLEKQGLSNISIWTDWNGNGNLGSCFKSFASLPDDGYTWHIQDDIIISDKFVESIKSTNEDIVCGFASNFDRAKNGLVTPHNMWFSFPCIKIPNKIAKGFESWCKTITANNNRRLYDYIKENKYDDTLFKEYLIKKYPDIVVNNLAPNIVNHIDYLIGGSFTNTNRNNSKVVSVYWEEDNLVNELKTKLEERGK